MKTIIGLFAAIGMGWVLGLAIDSKIADAHPRDNCECQELRAIRRILEQQFNVTCDERRCLPVPTGTPNGNDMP